MSKLIKKLFGTRKPGTPKLREAARCVVENLEQRRLLVVPSTFINVFDWMQPVTGIDADLDHWTSATANWNQNGTNDWEILDPTGIDFSIKYDLIRIEGGYPEILNEPEDRWSISTEATAGGASNTRTLVSNADTDPTVSRPYDEWADHHIGMSPAADAPLADSGSVTYSGMTNDIEIDHGFFITDYGITQYPYVLSVAEQESCSPGASGDPVRYGTGHPLLSFPGIGHNIDGFTHSSSWLPIDAASALGDQYQRMHSDAIPKLERVASWNHVAGSGTDSYLEERHMVALIQSGGDLSYHIQQPDGSFQERTEQPVQCGYSTMQEGVGSTEYRFIGADGTTHRFSPFSYDDTSQTFVGGEYLGSTSGSGGISTTVVSWASPGLPLIITRADSADPDTEHDLRYTYDSSGHIESVKLVAVDTGLGTETVIGAVEYSYYENGDTGGQAGQVKYASSYDGDVVPANLVSSEYYRYTGVNIELVIRGAGLDRANAAIAVATSGPLAVASIEDVANTSDLVTFASNYFEYDSSNRVIVEIAGEAGCSSCNQGLGQYGFEYLSRSGVRSRNDWSMRTVETLPGGLDKNVVYSNYVGQPVVEVTFDGDSGDYFATIRHYNSAGQLMMLAEPSAVNLPTISSIDDLDSLADWSVSGFGVVGDSASVYDDQGKVTRYQYYTSSDTSDSTLVGYRKSESVSNGDDPSNEVLTRSWTYTDGDNVDDGRHHVAEVTVQVAAGDVDVTSYTYEWHHDGTLDENPTHQMKKRTTTHEVAVTGENGSGVAEVTEEYWDTAGRLTFMKDAAGYVDYYEYDGDTGTVTKMVVDADPSVYTTITNKPTRGGGLPTALELTTTYDVDDLGRVIKMTDPEGNETHTIYYDEQHATATFSGWTGTSTTGPITIQREVRGGTVFTETMTLDADPDVVAAAPDPDQTLANLIASGTIESLTRSITNNSGQVVEVDRYHDLSGITYSDTSVYLGTASNDSSTGNYHATFGTYDDRGRSERSTDATGTITWNVYDGLGRVTAVYAGTDATGWSHGDPVGTDPANNMALIAEYEYDHGEVGDGNLTKMIEYPGGSAAARVTLNHYDWRNRLVATHSGLTVSGGVTAVDASTDSLVSYSVYDNLGRVIEQRGYAGGAYSLTPSETDGVPDAPADGALRSMSRTHFDDRGRVYRTEVFDVDPVNGDDPDTITGSLASDTWYDARGNVIKTRQPGGLVSKTLYDGAGRPTVMFTSDGGGDSLYVDADDVVGDNVLEQVEYVYDDNGNVIATVARQRHHDETATGDLTTTGTDSRDTYAASYYDDADRLTASVNVGTNGGSSWTRPTSAPARSDTVLVTDYTYDDAGRLQDVTDPRGLLTRTDYDLLGRTIATTENYVDGTPGDDNDRITRYTYDGVGNVLTLTADLPAGQADQTTKYEYAATIAGGSTVESNNILTSIWYPDPDDGLPDNSAQKETFSNNRLGQRTAWTDRNGTTHEYEYDVLGRLGSDEITTFGTTGSGTGVDDTVDRLTYAFDDAGRPLTFTSRDTTLGSTDNLNIVNRVRRVYNGFGQLTREYQSLDGNDDTDDNGEADSGVPFVEYSYDASGNFSRMESMTYPGGREVFYQYASGLDADVSRLTQLTDDAAGTALLESFTYLGLGTVVERGRGNGIDLTHIGTVTAGDDGGDQYVGFDRFGRIENMLWTDGTTTSDSFAYGYDRNGNRLYEENLLTTGHDELYHDGGGGGGYDGLNRLTSFARGDLNGTFDAITGTAARTQAWDLDALGNMPTVTTDGVAESRTTDSQNRLTDVGSETLAHSANGEMTEDEEGRELVYDAWGRLTEWVLQPGARGGAPIESVSYAYDTLNRRIARTPLGYTRSDAVLAGGELYFHSVQWQVIEERDDTDDLLATNVWSPVYVDAMIARDENAQGVLDTAFDGDGQVTTDLGGDDSAESVAIQSDGKIVVGGTSDGDFALARYNTDGTLDTTFGTSGTTVVDIGNTDTLGDIAILSSGKILAVGGTDDGTDTDIALAVFNSDGSLYTSWASGGIRVSDYGGDEFATSVAVQSDGKIVVAGTMNDDWVGARYNTNGTLDTTFSSNGWASFDPSGGGVDIVQTVAIDGSGKIVVGGSIGSTSDSFAIGRLTSAGAWDTSFSGNGWVTTSFVGAFLGGAMSYDLALQSDGKIVAVGYSPVQGGPASLLQMTVVRYTTAGGLDTTFGEAGKLAITGYSRFSSDSVATSVKLQSDGKIVVGGFTGDSTSSDDFALARLETDGTLDRSFGPGSGGGLVTADFGGEDQAWDIALLSDGRVVTVGHTDVGTDSDFALTVHHAEDPATRRLYAQHDANFNVTAIADAAGSVVERYLYDAYGLRTVLDADWTDDLDGATDYSWYHSHQGGRLDPLTGLHQFRNRDYDAVLMRWTRQDPLGYVDGVSRYQSYGSSPVDTRDSLGLFKDKTGILTRTCIKVAPAAAGAAAEPTPAGEVVVAGIWVCVLAYEVSNTVTPPASTDIHLPPITQSELDKAKDRCDRKPKPGDRDRTCSDETLEKFRREVWYHCKQRPPRKCHSGMTCTELRRNAKKWSDCKSARKAREDRCWHGGDKGHKEAIKNTGKHAGRCYEEYAKKLCGWNTQ